MNQPHQAEHAVHPELEQPSINPDEYLRTVFSLYRQDQADYRGRRNEDQQVIAEISAEEADEYFDQALLGLNALASRAKTSKDVFVLPATSAEEATYTLGNIRDGASLKDMRDAWRQLWVGVNVLTNRLGRDSEEFSRAGLREVVELDPTDQKALKDTLFSNFQDLNALRFGAAGSGIRRHRYVTDPDTMRPKKIQVDGDIAPSAAALAENAQNRGYAAKRSADHPTTSLHAAGKMTPEEFVGLRQQYPEVAMDQFAHDASFLKHMAAYYEQSESH